MRLQFALHQQEVATVSHVFKRVDYSLLNGRQMESYNFQKVSAVMADYGFSTIRLSDDWEGADFIAQHLDGITFLKVQLKGRPVFDRKYQGKDLFIAFPSGADWYLYPHDTLLEAVLAHGASMVGTSSWETNGTYSFPHPATWMMDLLEPYRIAEQKSVIEELFGT